MDGRTRHEDLIDGEGSARDDRAATEARPAPLD